MMAFLDGNVAVLQDLSSGARRTLYDVSRQWNSGVVWSPDSQFIAYVRKLDGSEQHAICMLRVSDSVETQIAIVDLWQRFLCFVDTDWLKHYVRE
jgi:Tol biopolymer transport system component